MNRYENLDLRIRSDGNTFVVSAQHDSQLATEPFDIDPALSWELDDLEKLGPAGVRERGAALYEALLHGTIRDLYQQALGGTRGDAAAGVRVRIQFDPADNRLRRLAQIPWEILYDKSASGGSFPALDPRRPIIRVIDSMEQPLAPAPGPLKRVLLALSNSLDEDLDLDRERAAVERALASARLRPDVLASATRSTLQAKVSDMEPQVVHFMGHGDLDDDSGEGVLALGDEYGFEDYLKASTFAAFFAGKAMPRLVILSACLTATAGGGQSVGPFASVAMRLAAAGVPAVIAMQAEVLDIDTIRFTDRLYSRLVQGDAIEAAVANARTALWANRQGTLAWAAPVLFMRGAIDEALFEAQAAEGALPPGQNGTNVANNGRVDSQFIIGSANLIHSIASRWFPKTMALGNAGNDAANASEHSEKRAINETGSHHIRHLDPIIGAPNADGDHFPEPQGYADTSAIRCQEVILRQYTGTEPPRNLLIDEAREHGWYHDGNGANPEDVGKLLELHGLPVHRYANASPRHLAAELGQGHTVIIGVDSDSLWQQHPIQTELRHLLGFSAAEHATVVAGIDTSDPDHVTVVVSDPGTGEAAARYPIEQFLAAWNDSHFYVAATQEPPPPELHLPEMSHFDDGAGHVDHVGDLPDQLQNIYQSHDEELLAGGLFQRDHGHPEHQDALFDHGANIDHHADLDHHTPFAIDSHDLYDYQHDSFETPSDGAFAEHHPVIDDGGHDDE